MRDSLFLIRMSAADSPSNTKLKTRQLQACKMVFTNLLKRKMLLKTIPLVLLGLILFAGLWKTGFKRQRFSEHHMKQLSEDLPGCLAIISGNIDGKKTNLVSLLGSRSKKTPLSEDYYINATKDCPAYIEKRGYFTEPLSEEEKNFPIAYSMVIHEKIEMFERLLRSIYAPQNIYCVHVDRKSPVEYHWAVKSIVSCFPNVFIASKQEKVLYAAWSRVQADLNCMEDLLNSPVQWKYLINTCGTDFPIKTNKEMVMALKALNGRNNLESVPTIDRKKFRWEYHFNVSDTITQSEVKKSPPPINVPVFQGSAYFVFARVFVKHLIEGKNKDVLQFTEWEKDTLVPDENFWATLQRIPSVPLSMPANSLYDVSDMIALVRVVKWSFLAGDMNEGAPYNHCKGTYRREVCVYGSGDLMWLLKQHHLFANKFDPEVDDIAIRCIESILHFRALGHDPLSTQEYSDLFL